MLSFQDAHNTLLDFDTATTFFAVYDGHGGHEVAEYTALHFPQHILNNEAYKQGNFEKVLVNCVFSLWLIWGRTPLDVFAVLCFDYTLRIVCTSSMDTFPLLTICKLLL